ncbi:MAG: hypothetical protein AAB289_02825, partial [Chloroflexota bacterium]
MAGIKDKTAIVGIGETEYSINSGRSEVSLACEAVLAALADAGLTRNDVDGMVRFAEESTSEALICTTLGIPNLRFFGTVGYGGGGSHGIVAHAAMAAPLMLALAQVVRLIHYRRRRRPNSVGNPNARRL